MTCFKLNLENKLIPLNDDKQWSRYKIKLIDGTTENNIYIDLDNLDIFLPEIKDELKTKFQDLQTF